MTRRVLIVGLVLAGVVVTFWAARHWWQPDRVAQPSGARLTVFGRLGALPPQAADSPVSVSKVKLGSSTRTALSADVGRAFEIELNASVTSVRFSIGTRDDEQSSKPVKFWIEGKSGDQWVALFDETADRDTGEWLDRTVNLGARYPRLRFRTSRDGGEAPAGKGEAYWGSVALLGEERTRASSTRATPNVILISLDTLRADFLSYYGVLSDISPHTDELLRQSFVFERAYAQYPNTPVSHASIFTSLYPRHHGVYETSPWLRGRETLADRLSAQGYVTVAFTENAFVSSDFGFDQGFDWYDNGVAKTVNPDDRTVGNAAETFGKAAQWLTRIRAGSRFFSSSTRTKCTLPTSRATRRRGRSSIASIRITRGYSPRATWAA